MRLGSLFDGSGTAPLAATMCGIEPVWASEIEPYPIKVTKARFPEMAHLGDITKINGAEVEPVDIICGGSPCQDLSVAGKQKGLQDGDRSHLFYEMTRIIKEMREATNGKYPRYIIWENVPGAFSSNNGRDFHAVLQAFAEIADPNVHVPEPPRKGKTDRLAWRYAGSIVGDGWSIAWRTVDAQYWGVPQRRRRIYLIADLTGGRAGEILFERKGMPGNTEPSRTQGQETAADTGRSTDGSAADECLTPYDVQSRRVYPASGKWPALYGCEGGGHGYVFIKKNDKVYALQANGSDRDCLSASFISGKTGGHGVVYHSAGFNDSTGERAQGSIEYCDECCPTLRAGDAKSVVYDTTQITSPANYSNPKLGDPCHPLAARQHPPLVVYDARGNSDGSIVPCVTGDHERRESDYTAVCVGNGQLNQISMAEQSNCLDCMHDKQAILTDGKPPRKYIVRRLTPLECCRLQGFPDWWEDGVEGSDSARYKMWGNGMALPNMLHVMKGIAETEDKQCRTMS